MYHSIGFHVLLALLSRRLIGELIVFQSSRRLSVRACVSASVRPLTLSNMNISATSWPIGMKFYMKHHWGGGKASVRFDPDLIRTLASMATDSSHSYNGKKRRHHVFSNAFAQILFILAGNDDIHMSLDEFEIWPDLTTDYGVSCP